MSCRGQEHYALELGPDGLWYIQLYELRAELAGGPYPCKQEAEEALRKLEGGDGAAIEEPDALTA